MAENKTKPTIQSVTAFLNAIADAQVRKDCFALVKLMESVSKTTAVMWGSSIVGFGTRHYVYESGREGDTVILGFAPRKQNIALYLTGGLAPLESELAKLGTYKTGGGCLYIKTLSEVHLPVLKKILSKAWKSGH
jgi:hypothetical protein